MARTDMFFKATGARTGEIVGETSDKRFPRQMDIVDWNWSMSAPSAVGGQRTGRMLVKELQLVKRVDNASTALMSVMANNELLTTAVLSVRKSGGATPLPFFVVTLDKARIIGYEVQSDIGSDGGPTLTETISLAFKSATFDHTVQGVSGSGLGASSVEISNDPNP